MTALADRVRDAVGTVEDPEIPVTLVDLGLVREVRVDGVRAHVTLRPTRLACPAREEMARRIRAAIAAEAPELEVELGWELAEWRGGDVTRRGAAALVQIGYGDPTAAGPARCPYCGSSDVRREGHFGGSVCKLPYSCRSCGSVFDELRGAVRAGDCGDSGA